MSMHKRKLITVAAVILLAGAAYVHGYTSALEHHGIEPG